MRRLLFALVLLVCRFAVASTPGAPGNLYASPGATMSGNYLVCTLNWTNSAPLGTYVIVQSSGDGATWTNALNGVHNQATTFHVANILTNDYLIYRVIQSDGVNNSDPSNLLPLWGVERPSTFVLSVDSTNQVEFHAKNQCGTFANGYMVEKGTNTAFTGTVTVTDIAAVAPGEIFYGTNTGFARDVTYYFRVSGTNSQGHFTEWSPTLNATPNAAPGPPSTFSAYNGATGVHIDWNIGGGVADMWYVQVSVGDTNSFGTIHTGSGQASFSWTDTGETPGTSCYYRLIASNSVGVAYSVTRNVVVSETITGSTWFIDKAATGAGNGTNWANAWPNFSSIAWNNLQPGATVWIAPGNYDEIVYVAASGSSNAPITFKLATTNAPGSQGIVRLACWVNQSAVNTDVHVDGARSDTFTVRVLSDITNNCGIQFKDGGTAARPIYSHATGTQFKWVEVAGSYTNSTDYGETSVTAFFLTGGALRNTDIGYCWVHDITGDTRSGSDGFAVSCSSITGVFGQGQVHHSIFQRLMDNIASGGATGLDIHDNWFLDWVGPEPSAGHPDGLQFGFDHCRIYNNVFRDLNGYAIYEEYGATNVSDVYIYNNVFYGSGALTYGTTVFPKSGFFGSTEPNLGYAIPITASNFVFFNNTFYGHSGSYMGNNQRSTECTVFTMKGWRAFNNLAVTHEVGGQFGAGYTLDGTTAGTNFSTADVMLGWNNVSGVNTIYGWQSSSYSTGSAFDSALGFTGDSNTVPLFAGVSSTDFHLLNQTNLTGTNLSAWESIMPGISRNADGTLRSATGWPKGALCANQGEGLVLWLSFDNWTGTNNLEDASPSLNNLTLPYSALNTPATNFPAATNGPNGIGAGLFTSYRYGILTNLGGLLNLTNGTVALWGQYSAGASGDSVFLDAGNYGGENNWWLGRDDSFFNTRFWIHDAAGNKTNGVSFPDGSQGVESAWMHYAVTWAGNVFVGYTNGVAFVTNTIADAPFRTVTQPNGWMAVGCYTHGGTPDFTDNESATPNNGFSSYPNNGWLQGAMADVRVYNRMLSASEVQAVYSSAPIEGANPTNPPSIGLTSPANGSAFTAPATISLAADVTANSHTIDQVQFFNGVTLLGGDTNAPYSFSWTNVAAGSYALSAQAMYDSGSTVTSSVANVTVTNLPPATNSVGSVSRMRLLLLGL